MLPRRCLFLGLALVLSASTPALAADPAPAARAPSHESQREGQGILGMLPADSVTDHVLKAGNQEMPYTATAGTLDLFGQDGEKTAAIFYTAYVARNGGDDRPLTFVFNGGPGAGSAFLNLGLVGPRIVDFGPTGHDGAAARLVDNPDSWLQFTDLVLIDPIGTGWSRTTKSDDAENFYGVRSDAQSIAKAIALYVSHNGRSASPKFLLGESYGGFRAAKVASTLREEQGMMVSGIVMLSPLIDGQLVFGADGWPFGAALQLPSLAAAEMERRGTFSEAALHDAETFAVENYLPMLAGPPPKGDDAKAIYGKISELTGIPADVVSRSGGYLADDYVKHSASSPGDVVSPYDAAFQVPDPYPESVSDRGEDPVLGGFARAYGGAFSTYARDELGFKTDMTYTLLSGDVNHKWKWGSGPGRGSRSAADASDDIRQLLSVSPSFRLLVAQGYSDLVIPYSGNKFILDHLPPAIADRAALKLYHGGHMFYTRPEARAAFTADARTFFADRSTVAPAHSD